MNYQTCQEGGDYPAQYNPYQLTEYILAGGYRVRLKPNAQNAQSALEQKLLYERTCRYHDPGDQVYYAVPGKTALNPARAVPPSTSSLKATAANFIPARLDPQAYRVKMSRLDAKPELNTGSKIMPEPYQAVCFQSKAEDQVCSAPPGLEKRITVPSVMNQNLRRDALEPHQIVSIELKEERQLYKAPPGLDKRVALSSVTNHVAQRATPGSLKPAAIQPKEENQVYKTPPRLRKPIGTSGRNTLFTTAGQAPHSSSSSAYTQWPRIHSHYDYDSRFGQSGNSVLPTNAAQTNIVRCSTPRITVQTKRPDSAQKKRCVSSSSAGSGSSEESLFAAKHEGQTKKFRFAPFSPSPPTSPVVSPQIIPFSTPTPSLSQMSRVLKLRGYSSLSLSRPTASSAETKGSSKASNDSVSEPKEYHFFSLPVSPGGDTTDSDSDIMQTEFDHDVTPRPPRITDASAASYSNPEPQPLSRLEFGTISPDRGDNSSVDLGNRPSDVGSLVTGPEIQSCTHDDVFSDAASTRSSASVMEQFFTPDTPPSEDEFDEATGSGMEELVVSTDDDEELLKPEAEEEYQHFYQESFHPRVCVIPHPSNFPASSARIEFRALAVPGQIERTDGLSIKALAYNKIWMYDANTPVLPDREGDLKIFFAWPGYPASLARTLWVDPYNEQTGSYLTKSQLAHKIGVCFRDMLDYVMKYDIMRENLSHDEWMIPTIDEWGEETPGVHIGSLRLTALLCYEEDGDKFWMPELAVSLP